MVANGVPNPWRSLQAILGLQMEGVEVNICCRMDNQGNVTPMVNGRVVQVLAGVATLPTIAIVLNASTTDQASFTPLLQHAKFYIFPNPLRIFCK